MMKQLKHGINLLVYQELELAQKDNGRFFASAHEAESILREEIQEADEAFEVVRRRRKLAKQILKTIKQTDKKLESVRDEYEFMWECYVRQDLPVMDRHFRVIEQYATDAAAELIQVAAMCRKWKQSQDEWKRRVEAKLP